MPELQRSLPEGFNPQSMIDVRTDKRTRTIVLFLRLFSVVFFVPLFAGVPLTFRHQEGFDPVRLWEIGLGELPWFASFAVLGAGIFLVVLLHELLHAAVLRLMGSRTVFFGIEGISPVSYDRESYLPRLYAFVHAVVPFFFGSIVGVIALILVPDRFVSWAFLPAVANGVVAGADFVIVAWLVGTPKEGLVAVLPEGHVVYGPGPGPEALQKKGKRKGGRKR